MIQINEFILNEKLIKAAMPHIESLKNVCGYPPPATKIIFIDNSELILLGVDVHQIYNVLNPPLT